MRVWKRLKQFFWGLKKRLTTKVEDQVSEIIKSRHELMQVFDGFDDPVVVIDKNFVIQRVNRATLTALKKKSFKQFIGKPCYEMLHGLKERCPQCTAPATFSSGEKTLRTGYLEAKEKPLETTFNITCYPLTNEEGEVTSVAEYYRDSSEVVQLTMELYESERARVMEPLAAGLSHQLRQPLTVMRAGAQYGLETFKKVLHSDDFQETMESILQNVDTVNDLLTDFLHFSKPSQYKMKRSSLPKLLEQGLRLVRQQIKDKKISLTKDWTPGLPEILMDEKLLLQAYLNLLVNSLESMTHGGRLTIKAFQKKDALPPKIFIIIEDTGRGIPKELISKLKQPFFSTKEGGVGLGLPVAEGIIRSHGGHIGFESLENRGTKVVIELPLAP